MMSHSAPICPGQVLALDVREKLVLQTLRRTPFPQGFLSVKAATADGASDIFKEGQNRLTTKEGAVFSIEGFERLHNIKMVNNQKTKQKQYDDSQFVKHILSHDKLNLTYDAKTWHEILGDGKMYENYLA